MEEKRCAALCGEVRDVDMYCHDEFGFSPSRRRGKGDLFTVRGLPVSFIQSCESVTTRIVGYRCARKEDSRSHVEREGAYYHQKREQTQETALALVNTMSRYGLIHIRHGRGEKKRVQTLSTMRSSNIQHWYDIHDKTPFFVPDEAHEENKADRRKDERSDLGVASETEWGEHRSDHDETWEEGREVSPEWRYL